MRAMILLLILTTSASAHEAMSGWSYPPECCGGAATHGDCAEIESSRVREVPGGYMIDNRFMVPFAKARDSKDGHYHACFPKPDDLRCFFRPPSSS